MTRVSVRDLIREIEALHDEDRDPRVGPSDYGRCEKAIELRIKGAPAEEPIEDNHAAIIGTMIHEAIASHVNAQHRSHGGSAELAVQVPGLERSGTADLVWAKDGELVDVKTVSSRAFDRIVTHGAKDEHMGQADAYALGLNRARIKITTCTLAYVNRENGDVHEVSWDYNEERAREVVSWLVNVEQMIDDGFDMPRRGNGPDTGFPCDWCPFWRTCWDVEHTPADRSHASKFTRDDELDALIDTYIDMGETEREAKAARAAARARLVGISYEANGRKLSWSNGGRVKTTTEDEIDVEALTALAVAEGIEVPMTTVTTRVASRINAKRVNTQKEGSTS